jgi:hypothetical protein
MAIQDKDITASREQLSGTASSTGIPSDNGPDVATYPYKPSSHRHVVWRSITAPIGVIFISVVVMVALLSFGIYPSVKRKPMLHGLLEVDVTRARAHLRDHQAKSGESLSFTAFITLSFDHAIIDGAPAARFTERLKDLIESGYGLCQSEAENVGSLPE